MPDWPAYVRERLQLGELRPEREGEIVEEVARQLEDAYEDALGRGLDEKQAQADAAEHITDWDALAAELRESPTGRMPALDRLIERAAERRAARTGMLGLFAGVWRDFFYGMKLLAKSRGFAAAAILTIALGIGANAAVFSVIDAVMLRPLPAKNPSRLVLLGWRTSARYIPNVHSLMFYGSCYMEGFGPGPQGHIESDVYTACSFSEPLFHEIERAKVFSGASAFADLRARYLSGIGSETTVDAEAVSGSFFHVMGVKAAAGRLIEPADDTPSAAPVAVLSYGYWQSAFGGSRSAIGRTIELQGFPLTVVGVAETGFAGLTPGSNVGLWLSLSSYMRAEGRPGQRDDARAWWLTIIGRLRPGERRAQAQVAVNGLLHRQMLHGAAPLFADAESGRVPSSGSRAPVSSGGEPEVTITPAQTGLMGYRGLYANTLYVLMFAVGLVLLIACANVAGLLLARANARQKEIAVRLALGAGRSRVVRQLLTESVTVSLFGGALGVLFAYAGAHAIVSFVGSAKVQTVGSPGPIHLRILEFTAIDPRILGFTLAISLLVGILFGVAPAFRNARVDLTPALKQGARGATNSGHSGGSWLTLGNGLVMGQVAMAVVVTAGAGLLVRTLANLRDVDLGFDTHHVLSFAVWTPPSLSAKRQETLSQELERRLAEMPGVQSASNTWFPLLTGASRSTLFHWPGTPTDERSEADELKVGSNFFSTMRIPLLAGRLFKATDFELAAGDQSAKPSQRPIPVIVNRKFVERFVGKEDPLGIRFDEHGPTVRRPASPGYEITGVVGDARLFGPRQRIRPLIYEPSFRRFFFELRTETDPRSMMPAVRKIVAKVDPDIALSDVTTESRQIDQLLFRERLLAGLASFFGLLAIALASIGLYGLLSYEISQRTHEIGIRMAIGAQPENVVWLILRQGAALAIVGAALGIGMALGVTRYLDSVLYGVHADDPTTMALAAGLLMLVSLAACYIPARRATRVDPVTALREE